MRLARDSTVLLLGAFLVVLALPLATLAITGWFSRYASDDYCTAGIVLERGYLGAQHYWYTAWSGRFAFFGLVSAIELAGAWTVQVMPTLALVGSVAVGAWAVTPLAEHAGWRTPRLASVLLAELIVFALFASAPNLGQSLFWQTGVLTYTLPLVLLVVFGGWLARVLVRDASVTLLGSVGAGVLMCVAGGFSETNLAVEAAALGFAFVGVLAARERSAMLLVVAGLVGALLAGVILAAAPGNAERVTREDYPGAQVANIALAAGASMSLAGAFVRRFEAQFRPVFVATGLLALGLGVWVTTSWRAAGSVRQMVLAPVATALAIVAGATVLVWISFFPSYWVLGFDPPARIELVAQCFIVCSVAALGYLAGRGVGRLELTPASARGLRAAAAVLAIVALVGPLSVAVAQARQVPDAQRFAAIWDDNDRMLREAGQAGETDTVMVPPLPQWWGWDWVGPRADDFPNACVARYYGVAAVRSVPASAPAS